MFPANLKSLRDDHPLLALVNDGDLLLRRFNPDNPEHRDSITIDEGRVPRVRLKPGALTGFSQDGCSTIRHDVLVEAQIPREELLEPPKYTRLAEASVSAIREFSFVDSTGSTTEPFTVHPDAYPDQPNPKRHDVAHALIRRAALPTRSDRSMAVGALARLVFNPLSAPS